MNYIVYDLEFTVHRTQQYLAEIIEIGAIKLQKDGDRLTMTDLFHSHIKPSQNAKLSALTTEFTGVTQEQVNGAPTFKEAITGFQSWLGEDPYYLCSWGPDDKYQMVRHCNLHSAGLDWIRNYNDIQLQFTRMQGSDHGKRLGLKKSLDAMGIPFFGKQHNALDDAFNTAKLFVKIFPQLTLEHNNAAEEQSYTTEIVYSTGQEDNTPFNGLAQLLGFAM